MQPWPRRATTKLRGSADFLCAKDKIFARKKSAPPPEIDLKLKPRQSGCTFRTDLESKNS